MKIFFLFLGLLFLSHHSFAQIKDSLEIDEIHAQYVLGRQQGNPELVQSAVAGCKELIKSFEQKNDKRKLALTYTLLGQIYVESGRFAESKETLLKALELCKQAYGSDAFETIEAKKYLSWAYGYLGDLEKELQFSFEILETLNKDKETNILKIADLYNTIGMNYGLRNDRVKEREYLFKSKYALENYKTEKVEEKAEVQLLLMNVLNSLSLSYLEAIEYQNAILYAKKSLDISEIVASNSPERSPTMVVMARCYTLEKKCDSAVLYINKALELLEANQLKGSTMWLSYRSYKVNILGRCGKGEEAKATARGTIQTLLASGVTPDEALSQLLILSQNTNAELTKMEDQYREKEALAKAEQIKERYTLYGALLLLAFASVGGYVYYRIRQTKNELEIQKTKLDKSIIENSYLRSRMDPHFVSNCIRSVMEFIDRNDSTNAKTYLTRFDNSMRVLVNNSSVDLVSLADELETIENYLQLEQPRLSNGLEWNVEVAENVNPDDVELPPLVVQPFVENSIKHGVNGLDRPGKVHISVTKSDSRITITVSDNGRGINPNKLAGQSKGLQLTKDRLKIFSELNKANANLEISALDQGTKVTLTFNE